MAHELVIRGGTIVDGTGTAAYVGDVAIDGGSISVVGGSLAGDRVIDATGLHDRGTLEVGMRADVNVIDMERLTVRRPVAHHDLPAGGMRFLQPVSGYVATIVNGVQTRSMDTDTGERPGRLLRRP